MQNQLDLNTRLLNEEPKYSKRDLHDLERGKKLLNNLLENQRVPYVIREMRRSFNKDLFAVTFLREDAKKLLLKKKIKKSLENKLLHDFTRKKKRLFISLNLWGGFEMK